MGITNQELMVLKFVKRHKHIDADTIFDLVKKQLPRTSKATVYRNLNKLVIQRKIFKFEANNKSYYTTKKNQVYFVCVKCGSIKSKTSKYLNEKCLNFNVLKTNIIVMGICEKCQNA